MIWYVGVIVLFQFQRTERRSRGADDAGNRQLLQGFQKWDVKTPAAKTAVSAMGHILDRASFDCE
jgi:hypothetical protein